MLASLMRVEVGWASEMGRREIDMLMRCRLQR